MVSRMGIESLEHHGYRCTAPFDWGVRTRGALELAYAMLAHSTLSRPPDPVCMTFCTEVVARFDRSGFVVGHGEIALWLLAGFCDGEEPAPERPRSLRDRVRRIRPWGRGR